MAQAQKSRLAPEAGLVGVNHMFRRNRQRLDGACAFLGSRRWI